MTAGRPGADAGHRSAVLAGAADRAPPRRRRRSGPPLAVGIDRLLFNAVSARTALTIRAAGDCSGRAPAEVPGVPLRNRPLFRRPGLTAPYADLVGPGRVRDDPPNWQDWTLVDEFPTGAARGLPDRPGRRRGALRQLRRADRQGQRLGPTRGSRIQAAPLPLRRRGRRAETSDRTRSSSSVPHPPGGPADWHHRGHQPRPGPRRRRRGTDRGDDAARAGGAADPRTGP